MYRFGIGILSTVKISEEGKVNIFRFYTGMMKNPEIRKKKEEWHPCKKQERRYEIRRASTLVGGETKYQIIQNLETDRD